MRVVFDSSVTDFDRGGTSRYVEALLPRLREVPGLELHEQRMQTSWPWTRYLPRRVRILMHDFFWIGGGAQRAAAQLWPDLFHGAGFKVPATRAFPVCVTIHDDTPWDDPPTAKRYNRVYMRRALVAAEPLLAGAITSARTTAEAIVRRLPSLAGRLHVTPWGVDHDVFRPRSEEEVAALRARLQLPEKYALLVSPYGPRKNEARMLAALETVAAQHPGLGVVVAGRAGTTRTALPVQRLGQVTDDELAGLYSGAAFLMYVSISEGFGLPVLEAIACGCPAVVTAGTVLEEVAGPAGLAVPATAVDEIAAAAHRLLSDATLASAMGRRGVDVAAGYDWDRTARMTVQAWGKMAAMEPSHEG